MKVDNQAYLPENVLEETRRFNKDMVERLAAFPDQWSVSPEENRKNRLNGIGAFPAPAYSDRARTIEIDGARGNLKIRQFAPKKTHTSSAFLHFHSGGWMYGGSDQQDTRLLEIADNVGCMVFSVEYGLAPENPYPAAPDDCESAALWLTGEGAGKFGLERFAIGGESAGAHLATTTLLRLRDKHGLTPFHGALLNAGIYDLRITPSARSCTEQRLVVDTRDIRNFIANFLSNDEDANESRISPIFAELDNMPPALFVIGTADPLLDDTLFMSQKWASFGNSAQLEVFSEGCHVFNSFPIEIAAECNGKIDGFLAGILQK